MVFIFVFSYFHIFIFFFFPRMSKIVGAYLCLKNEDKKNHAKGNELPDHALFVLYYAYPGRMKEVSLDAPLPKKRWLVSSVDLCCYKIRLYGKYKYKYASY